MAKKNEPVKKADPKSSEKEKVEVIKKAELVKAVSEKCEINASNKEISAIISAYNEVIGDVLASGKGVSISGVGTFKPVSVPERTCYSFGKERVIPAHKAVKFKASSAVKTKVNE